MSSRFTLLFLVLTVSIHAQRTYSAFGQTTTKANFVGLSSGIPIGDQYVLEPAVLIGKHHSFNTIGYGIGSNIKYIAGSNNKLEFFGLSNLQWSTFGFSVNQDEVRLNYFQCTFGYGFTLDIAERWEIMNFMTLGFTIEKRGVVVPSVDSEFSLDSAGVLYLGINYLFQNNE